MIKEIPVNERPRERFLKYPATTIANHELIAIILRTGSKQESVLELSKRVLYKYDSLKELSNAPIKDLMKIRGIGTSKAIELLAAFELGKRVLKENFISQVQLHSPESIYLYLKDDMEMKNQEHFIALYLNTKGELVKKETLFIGSLNSSLIHPRELFKHAVLNSAASIIVSHNHPSGDPTPSVQDIEITKMLHKNSIMMDIELLDHIIIGKDRYYSFKEKGII
ncbi:MAG: DNA repair protein RadC [Candidatus Izimaplasma sp.]|nr:DNA repair protein RadC [Candidatus Izimaplasma bacterium]